MALLACFAHGVTTIRGAAELRVKESDRITATADALNAVGGQSSRSRTASGSAASRPGFAAGASTRRAITGSRCWGPSLGVCSQEGVEVHGADVLGVSFPDFADRLAAVSA